MSDEISNAELARQIKLFREELHGDVEELKRGSAAYVLREVYASDARGLEARMTVLEKLVTKLDETMVEERKRREQDKVDSERERRNDRRIVFAAFLAAFLPIILELVRATGGST